MKTTKKTHKKYHLIPGFQARFMVCLGVGILLAALAVAQDSAPDTNLIPNGSFEVETGAGEGQLKPEGWGFNYSTKNYKGIYVDDSSQGHSGERSVSIIGDETTEPGPCAMWLSGMIKVKPGTAYSVIGWIKTSECAGKGAWLWVIAYEEENGKAEGKVTSAKPPVLFSGTEDWQEWSAQIYIPNKTRWLRIACRLDGPGAAWFDDIQVSELE
ncbi:MAG: hypothetical protein WCS96_13645 [Victivallales bacterium]